MPDKVKLLYLINSFVMGGAEKAMVRILTGLDKNKYDIIAVSLQQRSQALLPELEKTGVEIVQLNAGGNLDIRVALRLYQLIKKYDPQVVVCSLFHSAILGRIIGKLAKVPVIMNWEHNQNLGSFARRWVNRSTSSFSDKILCDSEKVHDEVMRHLRPSANTVQTVNIGGIDLGKFTYRQREHRDTIEIGSVGMLAKQKGFEYLIEAARIISKERADVKFSVVGDGPEYENLNNLIIKYDLTGTVRLLGLRHDIPEILSGWDIYIQPSNWEGLCITVVEAMACGLPVVASSVGGIAESITDGINGFLIQPKAPAALAERISILINRPDLRLDMGKKARSLAEQKYSLQKMCDNFESVIDLSINEKVGFYWNCQDKVWQKTKNPASLVTCLTQS